jgi:hypothetical protein
MFSVSVEREFGLACNVLMRGLMNTEYDDWPQASVSHIATRVPPGVVPVTSDRPLVSDLVMAALANVQ